VVLVADLAPGLPVWVIGDPNRLAQVVNNFCRWAN
jgi:signal transduction histidine kinase